MTLLLQKIEEPLLLLLLRLDARGHRLDLRRLSWLPRLLGAGRGGGAILARHVGEIDPVRLDLWRVRRVVHDLFRQRLSTLVVSLELAPEDLPLGIEVALLRDP